MSNLKVLPLEQWMKFPNFYPEFENFPAISDNGSIGRDGFYLREDISWFEFRGIVYILDDCQAFISKLRLLNIPPSIRICEINALNILSDAKLITKEQRKLLNDINLRDELKELSRNFKINRKRNDIN